MKYLARINPKYFAAIHQCAAKGDVRYYLNAVQIERHPAGGVVIVATNGHFMGAMHDPDGWIHPEHKSVLLGTVSKRLVSACSAKVGPDRQPPELLWVAEKFSLVTSSPLIDEEPELFGKFSHLTEKTELVDGLFPDWRRVIPKAREQLESQFPCINGEYLEVFNKIGVMLSGQKSFGGGGIHLETSGEKIVVRFNNTELMERFMGIVMPMKGNVVDALLPSWAAAPAEESAAA
jgi:DNA polymerase-3 subunit beta